MRLCVQCTKTRDAPIDTTRPRLHIRGHVNMSLWTIICRVEPGGATRLWTYGQLTHTHVCPLGCACFRDAFVDALRDLIVGIVAWMIPAGLSFASLNLRCFLQIMSSPFEIYLNCWWFQFNTSAFSTLRPLNPGVSIYLCPFDSLSTVISHHVSSFLLRHLNSLFQICFHCFSLCNHRNTAITWVYSST